MAQVRMLPAFALLCALLLMASVGLAPRASAQANVPTHALGDAVAFGVQVDLGPLVQPSLDLLKQQYATDPNTTINELNFTGKLDMWHTEEVTEVTSPYYGIRERTAFGVEAHLRASVTSKNLPVAGTYGSCSLADIPIATKTVTATLDILLLETSSGISRWGVSDFALQQTRTNETLDLSASFAGRNLPEIDVNITDCRTTVSYRDVTYRVTADVDSHLVTTYLPALDLFDFVINDGENWWVNSTQTLSGTVRGTFDVQGIDPTDEEEFFTVLNATLQDAGFTTVSGLEGFPIVLEQVTLILGAMPYLEDGVLSDISSPVAMRLQAKVRTKTLADNNPYTVYEISAYTPTPVVPYFACYYSPAHGFVVGCGLVIDAAGNTIFELKNVPPQTAEQNIETTKAAYAVSAPGNPLADFFLKSPYLGLLLIVAAVIVIAALLSRRGRKPAPMPPPAATAPPPVLPPSPPEPVQEPEEL